MKTLFIYGDSITWGSIPAQRGQRFDEKTRYTGILQDHLGADYTVVDEGLHGRMMAGENAFFPSRNGLEQFGPIFASHLPMDLLVIFLGLNDTNAKANKTPSEIVANLDTYWSIAQDWCQQYGQPLPKLLLVSPHLIREINPDLAEVFRGAHDKTTEFAELYSQKARALGAEFFDAATAVTASDADGLHLDAENNRKLGEALADKVQTII